MGSCASSVSSAGVTCLGLATSLCLTALFAPFWLFSKPSFIGITLGPDVSSGIFLTCKDALSGNRECYWNDFDGQEDWMKACMVLWAAGVAVLLLCAIAAFFICCESCRTPKFASFITFGSLFAAICLIVTVVMFGVKMGDLWDRGQQLHYDWGYYLALVGSAFSAIAFLLFGCSIYCLRGSNV